MSEIIKLSQNNFTPLKRTPWAGRLIASQIKNEFVEDPQNTRIGESWEFSCDPDFPSLVLPSQTKLLEWVQQNNSRVFSKEQIATESNKVELLIKLLNPASPLSLQVHPSDDDANLKPDECGKPESWLVLHAVPGAGIYLGFSQSYAKQEIAAALKSGCDLTEYLNFIAVKPGDYFEILPGVTHAIGPGVVLLEPQRTLQGKKGKTFRMWDWGRIYDENGESDANGQPRELHIDQALKIIDPVNHHGQAFYDSVYRKPQVETVRNFIKATYPANSYYQCHLFDVLDDDSATIHIEGTYGVIIALNGEFEIGGTPIKKGESCMILNTAGSVILNAKSSANFALVHPANGKMTLS